jgi:hypothetical protein
LVNFYQTTRRYIPEDSYLRTHRLRFLVNYWRDGNECEWNRESIAT